MDLRQRLLEARTEDEFKRILLKHTQELAEEQAISIRVDHGSATRLSTSGESNVYLYAFLIATAWTIHNFTFAPFLLAGGRKIVQIWTGNKRGSITTSASLHLWLQRWFDRCQNAAKGPVYDALSLFCLHPSGHRFRCSQRSQHTRENR